MVVKAAVVGGCGGIGFASAVRGGGIDVAAWLAGRSKSLRPQTRRTGLTL
jgi:hypothetical protein